MPAIDCFYRRVHVWYTVKLVADVDKFQQKLFLSIVVVAVVGRRSFPPKF